MKEPKIKTYEQAREALLDMQSQIIHGSNCFAEIAEVMRQLKEENVGRETKLKEAYRILEFGMNEMATNHIESSCDSVESIARRVRYGAKAALGRAAESLAHAGTILDCSQR